MKLSLAVSARKAVVPALALLSASLLPAQAPAQDVVTQEMADRISAAIRNVPNGNRLVRVNVVDGKYVLSGFVDNTDAMIDARDALRSIDGLDMSLIDMRVIKQ